MAGYTIKMQNIITKQRKTQHKPIAKNHAEIMAKIYFKRFSKICKNDSSKINRKPNGNESLTLK